MISHTCQSNTEGQPKALELSKLGDIELCLLVPKVWKHYGRWRRPDSPVASSFRFEVGSIWLPWVGPAQNYLHFYPRLAKLLRSFKPDVIDLWEEPWSLVSAQAIRATRRLLPEAKIVSETEQNISKKLPPPFEQFRRYSLRHADHLVGRSREAVDVARQKGYAGPATVVPNAVDEKCFRPLDRAKCKEHWNASGFVIGYVGRLVEEKGIIDAVRALAETPSDVTMLVAGDGPLRSAIEQLAAQLNVLSRLRLVGNVAPHELPTLMNALNVLLLPSRTTPTWKEQYGRVIIEAHACGIPVIGSNSGAIPDVIGDGGIIVSEGDPRQLADAILWIRDHPESGSKMGMNGRVNALANCTWRAVAERMRFIYRNVVTSERFGRKAGGDSDLIGDNDVGYGL